MSELFLLYIIASIAHPYSVHASVAAPTFMIYYKIYSYLTSKHLNYSFTFISFVLIVFCFSKQLWNINMRSKHEMKLICAFHTEVLIFSVSDKIYQVLNYVLQVICSCKQYGKCFCFIM